MHHIKRKPCFGAVVLDLDGTLIDSVPDVGAAVNRLLESRRRRTLSDDEMRTMVGWGAGVMIKMAFSATGAPPAEDQIPATVDAYLGFYRQRPAELTTVYPGVREVLEALADDGVMLGVCSNKPHEMVERVLAALGMAHFFQAATGGDNVPHRKPDGRHVRLTLELMGADGLSAVMVGDSETDMAAGRDAGLPVVAVSYGYRHGPAEALDADTLIDNFAELPEALRELSAEKS